MRAQLFALFDHLLIVMSGEQQNNQLIENEEEVVMHRPETAATPAGTIDDTLVRAKRGDQAAFADLVREHQAMVYSIARHFFRDRSLAEDLAQEVFLHLYQSLASIDSSAHLKFWLRKVTSHRCIDHSRKHKLKTVSVDEAPELMSMFDWPDSMMQSTLRRFVGTLPEKPRLVIMLRYQEDLDPSEIAEVLEMPLNTVKSHLRRSLAILREKMTRCLGEIEV
jgi:RNA polymerase sigma-70 factor (ECF subfamily)